MTQFLKNNPHTYFVCRSTCSTLLTEEYWRCPPQLTWPPSLSMTGLTFPSAQKKIVWSKRRTLKFSINIFSEDRVDRSVSTMSPQCYTHWQTDQAVSRETVLWQFAPHNDFFLFFFLSRETQTFIKLDYVNQQQKSTETETHWWRQRDRDGTTCSYTTLHQTVFPINFQSWFYLNVHFPGLWQMISKRSTAAVIALLINFRMKTSAVIKFKQQVVKPSFSTFCKLKLG